MQVYLDATDVTEKSFSFLSHNTRQLKIKILLANFDSINSIGLKSFIQNLLMTKSSERKSDIFIGHTTPQDRIKAQLNIYI